MKSIIPLIVLTLFLLSGIRIANEWQRGVLFFLGRFKTVCGPGLFYVIPILEFVKFVDLRTVTVTIEAQDTITRDNVSIRVNAVVWYKIADPSKAIIKVENYSQAVYQFTASHLRNMIGVHFLDDVLKERNRINQDMIGVLNETVSEWGLVVDKVEIKDIEIPEAMQRAMAMEAEALREKKARIIKASAEYEASERLAAASQIMMDNPISLELRRMQMITEVGAEQNTTTIVMIPSDILSLAKETSELFKHKNAEHKDPITNEE